MKCPQCEDTRIEVIPQGRFAVARFCPHCHALCADCDGTGFVFERDAQDREHARPCSCQDLRYRISLFNQAKLPSQFYDATFDNFDISGHPSLKSALATARFSFKNYQEGKGKGLLFMGDVGVGKTRLVSTMLREYTLGFGIPSLFKEFTVLLSEIKSGYDQGVSEVNLLERINEIEILVIDELGKGRKSDWEINILDNIISCRYNMRKTTIFTTNYTDFGMTNHTDSQARKEAGGESEPAYRIETLKQRVLPRIYSRLKGMCDFIEMKGPDYRYPQHAFSTG
jgi:DNA replication protein DnaC